MITVVIRGETGSGKSSIAEVISVALADLGLDVTVEDDDYPHFAVLPGDVEDRVRNLRDKKVTVSTVQVRRME